MAAPTSETQRPRERTTILTPLGIRFWDPVRDVQVRDSLNVTARPETMDGRVTIAFQTASGVYAFQNLPGLHAVEHPVEDASLGTSPPSTKRFLITVNDQLKRFLPTVFSVDLPLPYKGIFLHAAFSPLGSGSPLFGSPPVNGPPGCYLFSAPTRPVAFGIAALRGHLVEYTPSPPTESPAAYAVLAVQVNGSNKTWYGIADHRGSIAVLFPYPPISSQLGGTAPLPQQRWQITVRVRYCPATLQPLPGTQIPDLRHILAQSPGRIWPSQAGPPIPAWSTELCFGEELVMRTDDLSTLRLSQGA